ncbi:MAG: hypothetical protein C3F10_07225 [Dehalococcoidia bacterium]|nr:MAG: hypothetical protein C3F10_07225 [Dehalococcoidia bacterium]
MVGQAWDTDTETDRAGMDPFPVRSWFPAPARVRLEGDLVVHDYDYNERYEPEGEPPPTAGLLDAFLKLRSPVGVLRFVRSFGPLGFCEQHGELGCQREDCTEPLFAEPVDAYLALANRYRLLLASGLRLMGGAPLDETERLAVAGALLVDAAREHRWDLGLFDRWQVGTAVDSLIAQARIRPTFSWGEGRRPTFALDSPLGSGIPNAAGALALQLGRAILGTQAFSVCSTCQTPYERKKTPAPGRPNYCPTCKRDGTADRVRKQEYRARRAKESS